MRINVPTVGRGLLVRGAIGSAALLVALAALTSAASAAAIYRFSGFRPGLHIYAYVRRKQTLARFEFGKAAGPCGTAKGRALLFPGGHPGHDKYTVTFEQTKHYSAKAIPRIVTSLNLFRF